MHQSEIWFPEYLHPFLKNLEKFRSFGLSEVGSGLVDPKRRTATVDLCDFSQGKVELVREWLPLPSTRCCVKTFLTLGWKKAPFSYVVEGQELGSIYGRLHQWLSFYPKIAIGTSTALPKEYYSYLPFWSWRFFTFLLPMQPKGIWLMKIVPGALPKYWSGPTPDSSTSKKLKRKTETKRFKKCSERVRFQVNSQCNKSAELTEYSDSTRTVQRVWERAFLEEAFNCDQSRFGKRIYCVGSRVESGNMWEKLRIPFMIWPIYQTASMNKKCQSIFHRSYYDVEENAGPFLKHLFKLPFHLRNTAVARQESLLAEGIWLRSLLFVVVGRTQAFSLLHDGSSFLRKKIELLGKWGGFFWTGIYSIYWLEKLKQATPDSLKSVIDWKLTTDSSKPPKRNWSARKTLPHSVAYPQALPTRSRTHSTFVNNFSI